MYTFSDKLFGATVDISLINIDQGLAEMLAVEAYQEALRLQKIFNIYDPESELSQLNKARKGQCSPELLGVLRTALDYAKKTKGAYDISLGKLFLSRKKHTREEIPHCSYKDIQLKGKTVELQHPDVIIDLGSIAKGYIVDKIVDFLKENGAESGLVNGRGDLRTFGEEEIIVDIEHPREKGQNIASVTIRDEAIATSGDYRQYHKNYNQSHLINNTAYSSVSVIAPRLAEADLLATVISVLDPAQAEEFIAKHAELRIITFDKLLNKKTY